MRVAVVLAAGRSRRFGRANKLLVRAGSASVLRHVLGIAHAAPAGRVIVVTGADRTAVTRVARGPRTTIVHARDHAQGMGASLNAALRVMRPCERQMLLFLGDMPAVPPALAARLARALRTGDAGVRPTWRGQPGHPVLLRLPLTQAPRGDTGPGRGLMLRTISGQPGCVQDVDTRQMLRRVRLKPGSVR